MGESSRRNDYLEINQKDFDKFRTDDLSLFHYFKDKFNNCIFFVKDKKHSLYRQSR